MQCERNSKEAATKLKSARLYAHQRDINNIL